MTRSEGLGGSTPTTKNATRSQPFGMAIRSKAVGFGKGRFRPPARTSPPPGLLRAPPFPTCLFLGNARRHATRKIGKPHRERLLRAPLQNRRIESSSPLASSSGHVLLDTLRCVNTTHSGGRDGSGSGTHLSSAAAMLGRFWPPCASKTRRWRTLSRRCARGFAGPDCEQSVPSFPRTLCGDAQRRSGLFVHKRSGGAGCRPPHQQQRRTIAARLSAGCRGPGKGRACRAYRNRRRLLHRHHGRDGRALGPGDGR